MVAGRAVFGGFLRLTGVSKARRIWTDSVSGQQLLRRDLIGFADGSSKRLEVVSHDR